MNPSDRHVLPLLRVHVAPSSGPPPRAERASISSGLAHGFLDDTPYAGPAFRPSQAGLFLVILGVGYAAAIRFRPFVWLLIGSKAGAFAFLVASAIWLDAPRIVGLLGCGDGLMGGAVAVALWRVRRMEGPR